MKNWKTTVGGFAAGLAMVAAGIKACVAGDVANGAMLVCSGLGLKFAGWHAQDAGQ